MKTTAQQIDRLRELEAAASPAPWNVVDYRHGDRSQETWLGILNGAIEIKYSALPTEENHANAALIAEMRNALPALLNSHAALVERVEIETERGRQWCSDFIEAKRVVRMLRAVIESRFQHEELSSIDRTVLELASKIVDQTATTEEKPRK